MLIKELVDTIYINKSQDDISVYAKKDLYVRGYDDSKKVIIFIINGMIPIASIHEDDKITIMDRDDNIMPWNDYHGLANILADFVSVPPPIPYNTSELGSFYVNGNNTEDGDGSPMNPFRTIEMARSKVIGSGTPGNPEYKNTTIIVAGDEYSVDDNLWISNVSWFLYPGVVITYTGTGYMFSTDAISSSEWNFNHIQYISGNATLKATSGGLFDLQMSSGSGYVRMKVYDIYLLSYTQYVDPYTHLVINVKGSGNNNYTYIFEGYRIFANAQECPIIRQEGNDHFGVMFMSSIFAMGRQGGTQHLDHYAIYISTGYKIIFNNCQFTASEGKSIFYIAGSFRAFYISGTLLGSRSPVFSYVPNFITIGPGFYISEPPGKASINIRYKSGRQDKTDSWLKKTDPGNSLSAVLADNCYFENTLIPGYVKEMGLVGANTWYADGTDSKPTVFYPGSEWKSLTYSNGWSDHSVPVRYKIEGNKIMFKGTLNSENATGKIFTVMPEDLRPVEEQTMYVNVSADDVATVISKPNGEIEISNYDTITDFPVLDGFYYFT